MLYVADQNPGHFSIGDLLLVLAATMGVVAVVYAIAARVLRGRGSSGLPALAAFLASVWLLGGRGIGESLAADPLRLPPALLATGGAVLTGLLFYGLARYPRARRTGATFLTLCFTFLSLWSSAGIGLDRIRARELIATSALARELDRPLPLGSPAPGPARDIYLIVLDEYANGEVLREVLGFDNRPFEDSLRALGFHLPASVASNYVHTSLSLPSLLNAAHLHRVQGALPSGSTDPTLVDHLLAESRLPRFLQSRGYRFVFFPSSWWHSTGSSPTADSVVRIGPRLSPGRELSRTELRRVIWLNTLSAYVYLEARGDDDIIRGTLEGVATLPAVAGPVFAFAHVLSPHPPYVFDRSCGPRPHGWKRDPAGYAAQLECLNAMLLATVTRLLRDADVPPVILLQGDHGTAFRDYTAARSAAQVPGPAARERFGAFGAYYLPGGGSGVLGDTVTVVNVLGRVVRHYLGADLPPEPNDFYLSLEQSPFRFHRVSPARLARILPR